MPRLFIALDIPEDVKKDLALLCRGLSGGKWVKPEQLHLTVRFIGDVDETLFQSLDQALKQIKAEAFSMRLQGVGFFPPKKRPRVLWVGIERNDLLDALRNKVESSVVTIGLEPEKRHFAPHITLARLKDPLFKEVEEFINKNGLYSSREFPIKEFRLYSSLLSPSGAIHTIEANYNLTAES